MFIWELIGPDGHILPWKKKSTFMPIVFSQKTFSQKGPSAPAVRLGYYQLFKKIHLFISNNANKAEVCCLDRFLLTSSENKRRQHP